MKIEKNQNNDHAHLIIQQKYLYNNVKEFGHQYISWNKKKPIHTSLEMNAINMLLWQN